MPWAKQNNTPNCNCSTSQLNREVKRNSDWKSNGIACISISDAFMSPFVPSEQIFVVHILFFSPLFFSTTSSEICESYHKYFTLFRYFHGFFFIVGKPKFSLPLGFLCCVLDCMDNECGIRSKSNRLSAKCCLFGVLICHLTSLHIFAVFMLLLLLWNCLFVNLLTLTISCRLVVAVIHSSCRCIPTNYMLFYLVLVLTFQNQTKSFSPLALFWFPHLFIQKLKHWGYTQKLNSFVGSSAKRTTMQSYKIFICKM